MLEEKRVKEACLITGTILAVFSLINWYLYSLSPCIVLLSLAILLTFSTILLLTRPIRNNKIVHLFDNIVLRMYAFLSPFLTVLSSVALIFMSILIVWLISSTLLIQLYKLAKYLGLIYINNHIIGLPIVYLSTLFTLVIISYFGDRIVESTDKFLTVDYFGKKDDNSRIIAQILLKKVNLRKTLQLLSIIVYMISVIEGLIGKILFNMDLWIALRMVALEILVTYIAIDTFIRNYLEKGQNKQGH